MRRPLPRFTLIAVSCALALLAAPAAPAGANSNWTLRQLPPTSVEHTEAGTRYSWAPLSGVSCPTQSLCVAVGAEHTLAFSQAPTGGVARWHVVHPTAGPSKNCAEEEPPCYELGGRLQAVSCASEALCVAVTYEGFIYASTDPTGGAAAWSPTVVNEPHGTGATHLTAVSCPSPSLCVAVSGGSNNSYGGRVLTSTNPTAGQWQVARLGSSLDLRGVSCGTPSLCVAVAREGRIFVSTDPTAGASAWREIGTPGGPGDLEGVSCASTLLCAAGNLTGNILTSTDPAGGGWSEANAGGSVQITGVSCPTPSRCVAVDNNGDVVTSTDPTGGAASWRFENLVPFRPTAEQVGQPPRNALFAASCASTSLCALVGLNGRIFTATEPFSVPPDPPGRRARRRPRTIIVFAENFWGRSLTRHRRVRARFRFYSPTRTRGFECKRDRGRYRRCRSPLRYWVGHGRHALRVRAIGPTGLRGPAAIKLFRVLSPNRARRLATR
ncbi:MAG TPA: hypothetical protein VH476_09340 [Solirubrobacterales bacterium]